MDWPQIALSPPRKPFVNIRARPVDIEIDNPSIKMLDMTPLLRIPTCLYTTILLSTNNNRALYLPFISTCLCTYVRLYACCLSTRIVSTAQFRYTTTTPYPTEATPTAEEIPALSITWFRQSPLYFWRAFVVVDLLSILMYVCCIIARTYNYLAAAWRWMSDCATCCSRVGLLWVVLL